MFGDDFRENSLLWQAHLHTGLRKADGSAQFVSDIRFADMLEGAIVRAPVPRCRIHSINTAGALRMPGVRAVVTADDIDGKRRIGKTVEDQDFLCKTETYGVYDAVALIAADTAEAARAAVGAVIVQYEELPGVYTLEEAMAQGAPLARPDIRPNSNLLTQYHYRVGDTEAALKKAAHSIARSFSLSPVEHCYLETDCCVARFLEDGALEVYLGCHTVTGEQEILADALRMDPGKIHVLQPHMGGSFGGKDDGLIAVYTALLARAAKRPVRLWINRMEEMPFHTKRHGQELHVRMGFREDGVLLAAEYNIRSDTGSSSHHGENIFKFVSVNACGPYSIENVHVDTEVYYTNGMAMGAMRSWGITGITFANETMLNIAAAELQISPLEIRKVNAVRDGDIALCGKPIPACARYLECLERMDSIPLRPWPAPTPRYAFGVGYAGAAQGSNLHFGHHDQSTVRLLVGKDGHIFIQTAACDLGQGLETTLLLIVSHALCAYPIEKLHMDIPRSNYPDGGATGASRQTSLTGNAAYLAAKKLFERIKGLGGAGGDIAAWLRAHGEGLAGEACYVAPPTTAPDDNGQGYPVNQYGYDAQRAQVIVDRDTGAVTLLQIAAVCDCGAIINRTGAEGQVQGAILQGAGMALMEEFLQKKGVPQQHGFSQYIFPTATDAPPIVVDFIDRPADMGPLHAKGLAELAITATAPAIIAAIHDAAGIWIDALPATPEKVLAALVQREAHL